MLISKGARRLAQAGLLLSAFALAACDSSDERAQNHLERALSLIEENDVIAAELELRNALKLNKNLPLAHMKLGDIRNQAGNVQSAVGHYLRVIELDETALGARIRLGQIMLRAGQLDEALRHAQGATQIAPDNIEVLSLRAGVAFRLENYDTAAELADRAILLDEGATGARMVRATLALRNDDNAGALTEIDRALEAAPRDVALNLFKIRILEEAGRESQVGAVLENLVGFYPEEKTYHEMLARWRLGRGDAPGAEAAIRNYAAARPGDAGAALSVVQFLASQKSAGAAIEELNRLIAEAPDDAARFPYEMAMSELEFGIGEAAAASDRLRGVIAAQGATEEGHAARVRLAQILLSLNEDEEAVALTEAVLEDDPQNAAALSVRAGLRLRSARYDEAVQDIRLAQAEDPDNWRFMLLEAEAHKLNGSSSLAGERMAAAVEASNYTAAAVQAYARHLVANGKMDFAESLIQDGLSRAPNDPALLGFFARLKLAQEDWFAAEQIATRLKTLENGDAAAREVMARVLAGDDRGADGVSALERMVAGDETNRSSMAALVSAYVRSGRTEDAERFLSDVLDRSPDNASALILMGDLRARLGEAEAAEAAYRKAVAAAPEAATAHQALVSYLVRSGREDEAAEAARAGLETAPDATRLRLTMALFLEQQGDIQGAVAEYEILHEQVPGSFIVANNLASLMLELDKSPEQVDRAFTIAKRLRDADLPHYQNTYGWLLYLRGEPAQAARYLKPAAEALPNMMLAQLHLGLVYADMGLAEEARTALTRAIELGGDAEDLAEAETALAGLPPAN